MKKIKYIEIAQDIKNKILANYYPVGTLLPTENQLEAEYAVSKITVRNAVERLVQQGYVVKQSGKGTTVISNRPFNNLSKSTSFSSLLERKQHVLTKEIISLEVVPTPSLLPTIAFGQEVTKLTRLYQLDGLPYVVFEHFLASRLYPAIASQIATMSMYQVLANEGYKIEKINDSFEVKQATPQHAKLLAIDEEAILERKRVSFSSDGEIVEVSLSVYNTKRYPYQIEFDV